MTNITQKIFGSFIMDYMLSNTVIFLM